MIDERLGTIDERFGRPCAGHRGLDGTGTIPAAGAAHALPGGNYYLELSSLAPGATAIFNYRLAVTIR